MRDTHDTRALAPVIGMMLVLGVLIVTVAVAAVFLTGTVDIGDRSPNVVVSVEYNEHHDVIILTHDGGDTITPERTESLQLQGDDDAITVHWNSDVMDAHGFEEEPEAVVRESITAGMPIAAVSDIEDDEELTLTWVSSESDASYTIAVDISAVDEDVTGDPDDVELGEDGPEPAPAELTIDNVDAPDAVAENQEYTVTTDLENAGEQENSSDVEFDVEGEGVVDSENIVLDGGDDVTVDLTWPEDDTEEGEYTGTIYFDDEAEEFEFEITDEGIVV